MVARAVHDYSDAAPGAGTRRIMRQSRAAPDPPMLATFDRALMCANRWAVIVMLAAMASMVFANVALRFLTDQSILWVEEVSRFLMIWLTFLGSGIVLRYGAHVAIDTLAQKLPGLAFSIRGAVLGVLVAFFAAMVWLGTRYAILTWGQTTPVLGIPFGAVYLAMPIGFALMIVHLALMATEYVRSGRFLVAPEFDADAVKP
jgi:TRAP-type C4-dicarboxylate transport system permease small subunit